MTTRTIDYLFGTDDLVSHENPCGSAIPPAPVSSCDLLTGDLLVGWAHNSRIGPFIGPTTNQITFIGRDPNNSKRLIAVRSALYGNHDWEIQDDTFTIQTNDITSFDCHQVGNLIHVITMEQTTGKRLYHLYSLTLREWTIKDKLIASTTTMSDGNGTHVSTAVDPSSGRIWCYYEVYSTYKRCALVYSDDSGDTWSSVEQVMDWTITYDRPPSRCIADDAGRLHLFAWGSNTAFGEYYVQTRQASGTLSAIAQFGTGSALHQVQIGGIGDYCTWFESEVFMMCITLRTLSGAHYVTFVASNDMTGTQNPTDFRDGDIGSTFNGLGGGSFEVGTPSASARHDGTILHFFSNSFANTVPTWTFHKSLVAPYAFASVTPAGNNDNNQMGPYFSINIPGQELAAGLVTVDGINYLISLRYYGNVPGLVFNLVREDQLPTSQSFTYELWAASCVA